MAQSNILLESGTNELEIVEFYINEPAEEGELYHGYYGVNVAKVLEIIRMPQVTEMPEVSHPSVLGAFNQRSHIIPLVDLATWLGKDVNKDDESKVIVTEFNKVSTAFKVSGVTRIHRISWEDVEPPNRYVSSVSNDSITGVVKMDDRIIFILDLEKIVTELNPSLGMRLDETIDWASDENLKAIISDDSALIREMLKDLLQKAGFAVEVTHNGKEAWDRLQQLSQLAMENNKPIWDYVNVLVSDIEMPSMDGLTLTRKVKEDHILKDLPVMLFSSLITDRLRHKGESVGADDQISKPEVSQLALRAKDLIAKYMGAAE